VDGLRVRGIEREIDRAGVFVFVQDLLEGAAAVGGSKDTPLFIGAVRMAERGDEQAIGISRIDEDRANLSRVAKTQMVPRLAGIAGFVDAVADRQVGPLEPFAAADINNVGIA